MATIGVFSRHEDHYYGSVHTLTISNRIEIVPSGLMGEKAPQHFVVIGDTQVGAGWDRTGRDGDAYISIKLDDPSFPAPIFANLVERGNEHHLIWTREDARAPRAG